MINGSRCRRTAVQTADDVVLSFSASVKSRAIGYKTEVRKAHKRERFKRCVPPFVALLIDDICQLPVRNPGVDVSTGKESIELCAHGNRT